MKQNYINTYLKEIKHNPQDITEHTLRPQMQKLLESFVQEYNPKVKVLHEPKREKDYGAPDFKLSLHEAILGYVETKALGADLSPVLKTDQIARYKKLSDNILLTNYLDWIWIKNGKKDSYASLCDLEELKQPKFKPDPAQMEKVAKIIQNFLSSAPEGIGKPKALAEALGQRGKLLKLYLYEELIRQEREEAEGRLFGLYNTFKKMVDHELKLEEFTDTFAQMLVYGLFMARLNSDGAKIDLFNVEKFIPTSFELIHELVSFLKVLDEPNYKETKWIVEEVLSILNTINLAGITRSLSFDKRNRVADPETAKDPYVYFYEDFLAAYDKALKKAKGVYYTPPPVVNFIIRAVDDVLKDTFGIAEGLADHNKVTLLDFACGTGTFLLETIRQILNQTPPSKHDLIIKEHILKNLYGFEYMIAPYTVSHLKLTQYLKDRGYDLGDQERFKVYLTNTLDHYEKKVEEEKLLPALTAESKFARRAKDKPILVITGNPPYSYVSKNNGEWIKKLIKDYYFFDGKPLGERNPKGLQDDYVKFIRFAQWKMEQVEEGMVAIITNHSFLDNPTFRGMRQSLMNTFNQMYFLDLHGNTKKRETAPDGSKDENVFDIMQGVCISIFVKKSIPRNNMHGDIYGKRKDKYGILKSATISQLVNTQIHPMKPNYLFSSVFQDSNEYLSYLQLERIFILNNSGIKTHRDFLVIDFRREALEKKISAFIAHTFNASQFATDFSLSASEIENLVNLKKNAIRLEYDPEYIKDVCYRPLDDRYIYYDERYLGRARIDFMSHLLTSNTSLIIGRQGQAVGDNQSWNLIFITPIICDTNVFYRGGGTVFPLYLYGDPDVLDKEHEDKKPNIKPEIFQLLQSKYSAQTSARITPEDIMGYIYAVLHSPTYREKYKDFLKTDFPRIPFCEEYYVFEQMSALGWELINAHLMKNEELKKQYPGLGDYRVKGDNEVTKVWYSENLEQLYINPDQYFAGIPEEIYNFHIGGYQVLYKYLKDRKGRVLTLDEINNVEFIARILAFTREKMQEIDTLSKDWI